MYEKYAMGQDELKPLTLEGKTVFGDMAATLVDSLDTLWMMGLKPEFDRQVNFEGRQEGPAFNTKHGGNGDRTS